MLDAHGRNLAGLGGMGTHGKKASTVDGVRI